MSRIKVCSLSTIRSLLVDLNQEATALLDGDWTPWRLISITSGVGSIPFNPQVLVGTNCRGVLPLAVDDVVPVPEFQTEEGWVKVTQAYRMFGKRHAENVVAFLRGIPVEGPGRLVVHCEAGLSRSAAVARFAAEWRFGLDPDLDPGLKNFEGQLLRPNPIITNRLRAAVGLPLIPFPQTEILETTLAYSKKSQAGSGMDTF